jgi:hypothetical protein
MSADISTLLHDWEKWESMRDNAGRLAELEYGWERILYNLQRPPDASEDICS